MSTPIYDARNPHQPFELAVGFVVTRLDKPGTPVTLLSWNDLTFWLKLYDFDEPVYNGSLLEYTSSVHLGHVRVHARF